MGFRCPDGFQIGSEAVSDGFLIGFRWAHKTPNNSYVWLAWRRGVLGSARARSCLLGAWLELTCRTPSCVSRYLDLHPETRFVSLGGGGLVLSLAIADKMITCRFFYFWEFANVMSTVVTTVARPSLNSLQVGR